jgi:DNA adenine methylase
MKPLIAINFETGTTLNALLENGGVEAMHIELKDEERRQLRIAPMGLRHSIKVLKPFSYYGGKTPLIDHILALVPPHRVYCEPYAGSATVFWAKPPSPIEVLNDLDFRIVAFYRCLRDERLWQRLQELCELTPYSRAEYYSAVKHIKGCLANPKVLDELSDDELILLAWRFFIIVQMGINAYTVSEGWSCAKNPEQRPPTRKFYNRITRFRYFHERLKNAFIECDDAIKVIRRFDTPDTFFFVDPPYLPEVIGTPENYAFKMTEAEHRQLLDTLCQVQGKVMITHPRCPLYEDYLKGWEVKEVSYHCPSGGGLKGKLLCDTLWMNYPPPHTKPLPSLL